MPQRVKHRPPQTPSPFDATITVNRGSQIATSAFIPGVTLLDDTLAENNVSTVEASFDEAMLSFAASSRFAMSHIMWFGPSQTWKTSSWSAAQMSWGFLDAVVGRMNTAAQTHQALVVGMAPTWMLPGGLSGTSDASRIEDKPSTANFPNMAEFGKRAAARYTTVDYFYIWNELKGFYSNALGHWDYELYVDMYNLCYAAIKAARPDALIGGPYSPVRNNYTPTVAQDSGITGAWGTVDKIDLDPIEYFIDNCDFDFIVLDGGMSCGDIAKAPNPDGEPFERIEFYSEVNQWIQAQTAVPIHWAEFYVGESVPTDLPRAVALLSTALYWHVMSGSKTAHLWQPEWYGTRYPHHGMWESIYQAGGGELFGFGLVQQQFVDAFGAGTALYAHTCTDSRIKVIVSPTKILCINQDPTAKYVNVNGTALTLGGYETRTVTA